ncbi:fluoride efflux transporter CrcB [Reyranella sp.]|uniref:fluoride efflux transporter CrcB n=1 Tax=Reyranella sp. TaxID=1929291 RepID=UPI00272F3B9F|nr:fluoride efflux transporter CrcB [Reyranella sp.]MDP2372466.1 fluoride efflux transporter CrcB [Reyranella sp.]
MLSYLVVFVGAGIGGAARHGMNIWVARLMGTHFPWHTLAINILGSILMGAIIGWFAERLGAAGHLRLFLATGILGGFTTFSAFSLDAVLLWERHQYLPAALYVGGSVAGAIAGLALALWIMGKALA